MRSNHGPGEDSIDRPFEMLSAELSGVSSSCSAVSQNNNIKIVKPFPGWKFKLKWVFGSQPTDFDE